MALDRLIMNLMGLVIAAAWLTHIFVCFMEGLWGLLIGGAIIFPVGIVHGFRIWFGY